MPAQHKVLILNKPVRVYGYTGPQLGFLLLSVILAFTIARHLPPWPIAHGMPVSFLLGVLLVSMSVTFVSMSNVRPLSWWRKRIAHGFKPVPAFLPDLHVTDDQSNTAVLALSDGTRKRCMKCRGIDLLKLDHVQREDLASIFTSAVSGSPNVQVVFGNVAGPEYAEFFCIVFDEVGIREVNEALIELAKEPTALITTSGSTALDRPSPSYTAVAQLVQAGLELLPVTGDELRNVLFAHLSPAHYARQEPVPPSKDNLSDTLTLCKTGFNQQKRYVLIDDQFCCVLRLHRLPFETYVGWMRSLLGLDGRRFSMSLHFSYCDQEQVRDQVRHNMRLWEATRTTMPAPIEGIGEMRRFVQGGLTAFDLSCYTVVYANSLNELRDSIQAAKMAGSNCGAVFEVADLEQLDGLISCLPIGCDRLRTVHRILSPVFGTCWPFVNASGRTQSS